MAGAIAFNPIERLHDDSRVRDVFASLILQRLSTSILSGYFGLGPVCTSFALHMGVLSPAQLVSELLAFLLACHAVSPEQAAHEFSAIFSFRGRDELAAVPEELRPILNAYAHAKELKTDLLMFSDLLDARFLRIGTVADVGCGRNKLGTALLEFSDRHAIPLRKVVGTDVSPYVPPATDARVEYRPQSSRNMPIASESIDLVIAKWALHHMPEAVMESQLSEMARVLASTGRLVILEALKGDARDLAPQLMAEATNKMTWPPGPWHSSRLSLTNEYLSLSTDQQHSVLAMEDYYGHWLEQRFLWMPLPFTYMTASQIGRRLAPLGLVEDLHLRRVFGLMPLIHWGPPTVRLVFARVGTNALA